MNITDSGTQASTLANSGNAINLKSVKISFQRGGNVDTSEIINSNSSPMAGFGSVTAAVITIQGVIDGKDATDMNLLDDLNDLLKTYGVKLLYYTDTTDGVRDITDSLGTDNSTDIHQTNNFSGIATPHFHVRVTNFQITQTPSSFLRYTLICVETI